MNTFYAFRLKCNAYSRSPQRLVFVALAINFHTFVKFVEWKSNALILLGDFAKEQSTFPKSLNGMILCLIKIRCKPMKIAW